MCKVLQSTVWMPPFKITYEPLNKRKLAHGAACTSETIEKNWLFLELAFCSLNTFQFISTEGKM